jgi:hypothetical protein
VGGELLFRAYSLGFPVGWAILRHSNVSLTQNIYIKSVMESQVSAMDSLSEKLGICNAGERPGELRMHTS